MKKRLLSALLAVCMVMTMAPAAFAAEGGNDAPTHTQKNIARIEQTGEEYPTLAAVSAAVLDNQTITMLENVDSQTDYFTFTNKKDITINLNGKTIKGSGDWAVVYCPTGSTVTIDGTVAGSAIYSYEVGATDGKSGYATTVWSGTDSKVVINGGHYENVITTTQDDHFDLIYANGANASIEILDGTFKNFTPKWTLNLKDNSGASIAVKGGSYDSFDPSAGNTEPAPNNPKNYLAEGYVSVANGDKFEVKPLSEVAVAEISGTPYRTLVDAVKNAENGATIELLKDASGAGVGTFNGAQDGTGVKNFTIDFGGHTYTCTGPAVGSSGTQSQAFHLEWTGDAANNAKVTLKNGTVTATANSGVAMIIQNYCDLTLDNMVIDGSKLRASDYSLSNNCGNITIKDTEIIAPTGGVAFDVYGGFQSYGDVTVTLEGESKISGKVEVARGAGTQNTNTLYIKGGSVDGELSITDNAKTVVSISGGTFNAKVDDKYIAPNYECIANGGKFTVQKIEDKLIVDKGEVSDNTQSATLAGDFKPSAPIEGDNEGSEVNGYDVSLDLSNKGEGTKATTVNLTVTKETAKSLADADSLSVATDAGTVELNAAALDKVGTTEGDVVITVQKNDVTDDNVKASYTVSVKTGETNLLPYGESNGAVTITVPKDGAAVAWYVTGEDDSKVYVEKLNANVEGDNLVITIGHLSTIELLAKDPGCYCCCNCHYC